jgi:hypothetical protein
MRPGEGSAERAVSKGGLSAASAPNPVDPRASASFSADEEHGSEMLRCEDCGRKSDWEDVFTRIGDPRWRAYLIKGDPVLYCPDCARH